MSSNDAVVSAAPFREFTSITANVKEKVVNLGLTKKTAIVGEEASYKSAIGVAIRLALTGKYEPIGHNPSDLIRLAADPLVGIQSTLQGPDGFAEWRLDVDPSSGRPKRPGPAHFEGRLNQLTEDERYCIVPTDSVRDLMKNAKGERKLREALICRFGGSLKNLPQPFALTEEERKTWDRAVSSVRAKLGPEASADTMLALLSEHFRLASGAKRREITPIENYIAGRRQALSNDLVGSEMLPELEETLALARRWQQAEKDRELRRHREEELAQVKLDVERLLEEGSEASTKFTLEEVEFQQLVTLYEEEVKQKLQALIDANKMLANAEVNARAHARAEANGDAKCLYCARAFDDIGRVIAIKEDFERRVDQRQQLVSDAEEAYSTVQLELLQAREALARRRHDFDRESAMRSEQNKVVCGKYAIASAEVMEIDKRLRDAPEEYRGRSIEELEKEIGDLQKALEARMDLEREGLRLRELEREYDALKTLEKEATSLQQKLMVSVAATASAAVTRYMPNGRRAVLDPKSCEWSVVGADGQSHVIGAMCGTEETNFMFGLTCAWTEGSPLRVAIFDDKDLVGLSKKGMRDFFEACSAAVDRGDLTQAIIIWNRPDEVPEGWHMVVRSSKARTPDEAVV